LALSSSPQRAGLRVNELTAEKNVETAIVRANWRKNCPVMPEIKAQGINTHISTSEMAIIGPVTSPIAFSAASLGGRPCSR
jgi:hypothetical protein